MIMNAIAWLINENCVLQGIRGKCDHMCNLSPNGNNWFMLIIVRSWWVIELYNAMQINSYRILKCMYSNGLWLWGKIYESGIEHELRIHVVIMYY